MIKKIIYGKRYFRYALYDMVPGFFEEQDYISCKTLYSHQSPPDMDSVFEHLQKDGMISMEEFGIKITEKGKTYLLSGGYRRQLLKERLAFPGIVIGIITALMTVISLCR